jgi:hypothetical protein
VSPSPPPFSFSLLVPLFMLAEFHSPTTQAFSIPPSASTSFILPCLTPERDAWKRIVQNRAPHRTIASTCCPRRSSLRVGCSQCTNIRLSLLVTPLLYHTLSYRYQISSFVIQKSPKICETSCYQRSILKCLRATRFSVRVREQNVRSVEQNCGLCSRQLYMEGTRTDQLTLG